MPNFVDKIPIGIETTKQTKLNIAKHIEEKFVPAKTFASKEFFDERNIVAIKKLELDGEKGYLVKYSNGKEVTGKEDSAEANAYDESTKAAIRNSMLPYPMTKITVNLAPADLKKDGSNRFMPIRE